MTLLTAKKLTKIYDQKKAVNNVSFQLPLGKCIALIGPNGAGKTTILRTLAGLLRPTSGTVKFTGLKRGDDMRPIIGYLPQYPMFYNWMTGKEFLIYSGKLAHLSTSEAKRQTEKLLDIVDIAHAKDQRISKYSGGMKQRLGIAQAIIHKPKLLILDEPVSSLDPIGRRDVLTLMETLKKDMSILFSTHILTDADEVSDELLLLHRGEIVESGSMDELRGKYQTTTIKLSFDNNIQKYQNKIDVLPSVTTSYIQRHELHIAVTNISIAREEILTVASQEKWPLTNFSVNRASLEEMFMKVVNNSCNG